MWHIEETSLRFFTKWNKENLFGIKFPILLLLLFQDSYFHSVPLAIIKIFSLSSQTPFKIFPDIFRHRLSFVGITDVIALQFLIEYKKNVTVLDQNK